MFALDVVEEILLRSDAKDLVPWKRVCKSWYSLISSPHFAKSHLKTTCDKSGNELGHVRIAMPTYWKMPNVKLFEYNQWKLVGSSYGLVCFYRTDKVSLLLLRNPLTRELRKLPIWSPVSKNKYIGDLCLGFGYDSTTDDYKVVMVIQKRAGVALIQVLSLRSNTWKVVGEFNYGFHPYTPGILLNGALHWVVFGYTRTSRSKQIILSFDLSREEFKVIPQPNHPRYEWHSSQNRPRLGIVNDQMCIYFLDRNTYQPQEIWVMRSYNVEHSWEALPNNYEMKHQVVYHMKMVEFPSPKNRRMSFFCDDNKCLSKALKLKYWKACRYVPSLVSPDAARPSHAKNNKISVESWSIKAVKGEDQHSNAMLRRTIVETSKQEESL